MKKRLRELYKKNVIFKRVYEKVSDIRLCITMKMSDETFIKIKYKEGTGKKLDLANPVTFNEKLQWLKLYNRQPLYTRLVDKYRVRDYVTERIGEEYLTKLYGVYDDFEKIDFSKLPKQFVLKCNHDCGSIYICKDKEKLNKPVLGKKMNRALSRNYYWVGREWPYKNVVPCIVVEELLIDDKHEDLKDYKFFCFGGRVKALFVASDRQNKITETRFDFFDEYYNHLPIKNGHPNAEVLPEKPQSFELMINLAEKLSEGIPFVRVDFYDVNGRVYFGEMTFFHWGGCMPFDPPEWDERFGEWIVLPEKKKEI